VSYKTMEPSTFSPFSH